MGLNLKSYPSNLYVYGYTREGRVRSMGGSRMGKVVPIILKLTVPIMVKIFSLGSKLVSSLIP